MSKDRLAIEGGSPVSDKRIPVACPSLSEEAIQRVSEVLRSGNIRQGEITKRFEEQFRKKVEADYAYAVSSGTAALHSAFLSVMEPNDEAILPSFSFIAAASMVVHAAGRPVFADIDSETFLIDEEDVKEKITQHTKVISPVHLFGNAVNLDTLTEITCEKDIFLVNDCAQAHGTEYKGKDVGSYDALNCYSFYPSKNMTTGEGGMVTTNDYTLQEKGRQIRDHGEKSRYCHALLGFNYRMTEIEAALGLSQLAQLDAFVARRRKIGEVLRAAVDKVDGLRPQRIDSHTSPSYSYFSVVMELEEFRCVRNVFVSALEAENIGCAVHYPIPLHRQPALRGIVKAEAYPISEEVSRSIFSLPIHPYLSDDMVRTILRGIEKVTSHYLR